MYVRLGFAFYFKKIDLVGIKNIPRKQAVLFVANHQNALIDPLLIGALTPRELNFLTRADVFNRPHIKALLSTVNMLPIYRIRDGLTSLSKNEEVFKKCYHILGSNGTVLIFPEGNHNIQRRIRILSKGFTRIVFGSLEKHPEKEISVVPVGINYSNAKKYGSSVRIIFGKPISVQEHRKGAEINEAATSLKNEVSDAMKKLVTHIEDHQQHDEITKFFEEEEFLYPEKVNVKLLNINNLKKPVPQKKEHFNFLTPLVKANSILPLLLWKYLSPKIEEEEFIATYKFSLGITAFPSFYLLQTWVVYSLVGGIYGFTYFSLSFLSVYLFTKSR
jgi:1-acyl-sn-glycerol-3-phosphate acyltransferase